MDPDFWTGFAWGVGAMLALSVVICALFCVLMRLTPREEEPEK